MVRSAAITDEQRRALRSWYQQQGPSKKQSDAINWFERQYGRRIRQSTVSESLSKRYDFLDDTPTSTVDDRRQRQPQWPVLEKVLFTWQQSIENAGGDVPGDALIAKAKSIWPQIPDYVNEAIPEFSSGWLTNFKRRHNIKPRKHHGEAALVPEQAEREMRILRTLCGEYAEENIFSMDEIGLYWRQSPSSGLATRARKDKSRISIICCCNYSGSQRFPLWVVGKAARPHALRNVNIEALGVQWRSNTKAWINAALMKDWLQAFYSWIGSRRIVLLMDNLKAHQAGIDQQPPPDNIQIQYLPTNSTSIYQPLDQGIIRQFKRAYKKHWMSFMISCYEHGSDPVQDTNLHFAVRWASQAWLNDLSSQTIYRCFRRARIQSEQQPLNLPDLQPDEPRELEQLYELVRQAGDIQDAMNIENFLNPIGEDDAPGEATEFDLEEAIARYSQVPREASDDEAGPPIQLPSSAEAEQALELLILYQEYDSETSLAEIQALRKLYRRAKFRRAEQAAHGTLDNWLT